MRLMRSAKGAAVAALVSERGRLGELDGGGLGAVLQGRRAASTAVSTQLAESLESVPPTYITTLENGLRIATQVRWAG